MFFKTILNVFEKNINTTKTKIANTIDVDNKEVSELKSIVIKIIKHIEIIGIKKNENSFVKYFLK